MNIPIDLHTLSPAQHAALFDAARREAAALRREAIADAIAGAFGALRAAARRAVALVRGAARQRPQPRCA